MNRRTLEILGFYYSFYNCKKGKKSRRHVDNYYIGRGKRKLVRRLHLRTGRR